MGITILINVFMIFKKKKNLIIYLITNIINLKTKKQTKNLKNKQKLINKTKLK